MMADTDARAAVLKRAKTFVAAEERTRQADRDERERQARESDEAELAHLRELIEAHVGEETRTGLGVRYEIARVAGQRPVRAVFTLDERTSWQVRPYSMTCPGVFSMWGPDSRQCYITDRHEPVKPEHLETLLLREVGQEVGRRDEWARVDRENKALAEEARRRNEAERVALAADLERQDAEAHAIIDPQVAAARDALWRWPEGVRLTLYQATWYIPCADGEATERHGWMASDQPDGDGYYSLMPSRGERAGIEATRPLDPRFWTISRYAYSSVEDLPSELTEYVHGYFHGYHEEACDLLAAPDDGGTRFVLLANQDDRFYSPYVVDIGAKPYDWVRYLVDSVASDRAVNNG